jgi:hypothetical protein
MTRRAPWPSKPQSEIVASLRRALERAWSDIGAGDCAAALAQLEAVVLAAVCDLSTYTVEAWEQARAELESARLEAAGRRGQ